MAVDRSPLFWFGANYSIATSQVKFNTNTHASPALTELTDAQAHATTGDAPQVLLALLDKVYAVWLATAVVDRPAKFTIYRGLSEDATGHPVRTFSVTYVLDESTSHVVDAE